MSYCRFNGGESDVYVVHDGRYKCFTSKTKFPTTASPFECDTPGVMLQHLVGLRSKGLSIPGTAIDRLRREM